MRLLPVLFLLAGCATTQPAGTSDSEPGVQTLTSPCVAPAADAASQCPACTTDADCVISSNPCHPTAVCVPVAGRWMETLETCTQKKHLPQGAWCGCVGGVCRSTAGP